MKKLTLAFLFFICFIFQSTYTKAAADYLDFLFKVNIEKVNKYVVDATEGTPIIVKMDFNGKEIFNPSILERLKYITPHRIDYVYTTYRSSKTFDQDKLNRERLDSLRKYAPGLFGYSLTDWHYFQQTGASTSEMADSFFHGFIIYPVKTLSAAERGSELLSSKSIFGKIDDLKLKPDSSCQIETTKNIRHGNATGYYYPRNQILRKAGVLYTSDGHNHLRTAQKTYETEVKKVTETVPCHSSKTIDYKMFSFVTDSTVAKVLERNTSWNNMLIATDVTGSMSPYYTQLFLWFKLKSMQSNIKSFLFFNDGDAKADKNKVIGSTGGIYQTRDVHYEVVEKLANKAMNAGYGGDCPENNIEALLTGIANNPDANDIIMIADNYAPVKDISLLDKLTKPVHIILCGTIDSPINSDYLEIAKATKGTVHTMEDDLTELYKLNEGSTIKIGKYSYVLREGKFVVVRES